MKAKAIKNTGISDKYYISIYIIGSTSHLELQ